METDRCVSCTPGSAGCVPSAGACFAGLLPVGGRCGPPEPPAPPPAADMPCYTPCLADTMDATGQPRHCRAGLMEGCVDGAQCVDSVCVAEGGAPPACSVASECAEHLACVQGVCRSQCDSSTTCGPARRCVDHVCRAPCSLTDPREACGAGEYCKSEDGMRGFCASEIPSTGPVGGSVPIFRLDRSSLSVPEGTTASFCITVEGAASGPVDFEVRRAEGRAWTPAAARFGGSTPDALPFVELRSGDRAASSRSLAVRHPGDRGCLPISVRVRAVPAALSRWELTVHVVHKGHEAPSAGRRRIVLYGGRGVDGRWSGDLHYFASFGETAPHNSFLQRWKELSRAVERGGDKGARQELEALVIAMTTGSWDSPSVRTECRRVHLAAGSASDAACTADPNRCPVCYPLLHDSGVEMRLLTLVEAAHPVPSGVSSLPLVMHLKRDVANGLRLVGRVESAGTIQLPGDPVVSVGLSADLTGGTPVAQLTSLEVVSDLPPRYRRAHAHERCAPGYAVHTRPWLVPGFAPQGQDDRDGVHECHFGRTLDAASAARKNAIPDGRARRRTLSLVRGLVLETERLFAVVRETSPSFLPEAEPVHRYGLLVLHRDDARLAGEDYAGQPPAPLPEAPPDAQLHVRCAPYLPGAELSDAARATLLATGRREGDREVTTPVHAFCADTGLIDGGPEAVGPVPASVPCPAGSGVTYFTFDKGPAPSAEAIANLRCQRTADAETGALGSCHQRVSLWRDQPSGPNFNLAVRCKPGVSLCHRNRHNLTEGRAFVTSDVEVITPLSSVVASAFHYRAQLHRAGPNVVGFAPAACSADPTRPYCYDVAAIGEARDRIDCLHSLYSDGVESTDLRISLSIAMGGHDASLDDEDTMTLALRGFEHEYAELMTILGDDAFTRAYRARFVDNAAAFGAPFPGDRLERGGDELSGISGRELRLLYQAVHYYQLALERLYALSSTFERALRDPGGFGTAPPAIVTPGTSTRWLRQLYRTAGQKARALAEIARRYEGRNRADLAAVLLERSYVTAYVESTQLAQLMSLIITRTESNRRPDLERILREGQLEFSLAFRTMREVHHALFTSNAFGYPAGYVPLNIADGLASNPFQDLQTTTRGFVEEAVRAEADAVAAARELDRAGVAFQNALVDLRAQYDGRLSVLCGHIVAPTGETYAAIAAHASHDPRAQALGDPCGMMSGGSIRQKALGLRREALAAQRLAQELSDLRAEIRDEGQAAVDQCAAIQSLADFRYENTSRRLDLEMQMLQSQQTIEMVNLEIQHMGAMTGMAGQFGAADPGSAVGAMVGAAAYGISAASANRRIEALHERIRDTQREINDIELSEIRAQADHECQRIDIEVRKILADLGRRMVRKELEILEHVLVMRQAQADFRHDVLEARRLEQEYDAARVMRLRSETVASDPSVRIARDAAMRYAERTFETAQRELYRLTRSFEYYTLRAPGIGGHQSALDRLYQIRSAGPRRGDSLKEYLLQLEVAYLEAEDGSLGGAGGHGVSTRRTPHAIRLRFVDDVFAIRRLRPDGTALSALERGAMLRDRLNSPAYRDDEGRISIPFMTGAASLPRCTFGEKIDSVRVRLSGASIDDVDGDLTAYLLRDGISTVFAPGRVPRYFELPRSVAVVRAQLDQNYHFSPNYYESPAFREQPVLNSRWRLALEQPRGRGIRLDQLQDISLTLRTHFFVDSSAVGCDIF